MNNGTFAWLIEAPGSRYLGVIGQDNAAQFHWTADANKATRFIDAKQADAVMSALRILKPSLFDFEVTLFNAKPVEHGWLETV